MEKLLLHTSRYTAVSFLFCLLLIPSSALAGPSGSLETDRQALIGFYGATGGDRWTNNSGWKAEPRLPDGFNDTPCTPPTWFGITCNEGRVVGIQFFGNGLVGEFPSSVTALTALQQLSIGREDLTGQVYPELAQLDLITLELFRLDFSGVVPPDLGSIESLQTLVLFGLGLTGGIPSELGQLSNLVELGLEVNQLSGPIPISLGNLTNLTSLTLFSNHLSGRIPTELAQLTRLRQFDVQFNDLSGPIPAELGQLGELRVLQAAFNRFAGGLPRELGNLRNLRVLNLGFNRLGGRIPSELGNLTRLEQLNLPANLLTGEIPVSLAQLNNLTRLNLRENFLEGVIPPSLGSLDEANFIGLSNNRLSGPLPQNLDELPPSLLDVRSNRLQFPELPDPQGGASSANRASFQNLVALYPQLALGGGFEIVLQLTNRSINSWRGRIELDGGEWPDDRPWAVDQIDQTGGSSIDIQLGPQATRKLVLSSPSPDAFAGFLTIQALGNSIPEDVAPAFFYNLSSQGELVDSTGVAPSELGVAFHFPIEQRQRVFTGMAFRSVRRPLLIQLKNANGTIIASTSLEEDGAFLVSDLFPSVRGNFDGAIEVRSELPFYLTVLRGEIKSDGTVQLTSIPATNLLAIGFQMIFPFQ